MITLVDQRTPQIDAIINAAAEIHNQLGHGFHKAIYQEAAVIEFALHNIPFQHGALLPVIYKDHFLPTHYKVDFICYSNIFVEFASVLNLSNLEEIRTLNCLKATRMKHGLLVNFGAAGLEYRYLLRENEAVVESKHKSLQPA